VLIGRWGGGAFVNWHGGLVEKNSFVSGFPSCCGITDLFEDFYRKINRRGNCMFRWLWTLSRYL
jgi:hypothetical protein